MSTSRFRWSALAVLVVCLLALVASRPGWAERSNRPVRQIIVPTEDRFTPFAITIRVGQTVEWVNTDADDHTVVSDDAFNTAGHRGVNVILPANGGTFRLTFKHPGVFPFYCRFHAMLDAHNQPIAPGPNGGIQDANNNFGTPMNGVITVLGED